MKRLGAAILLMCFCAVAVVADQTDADYVWVYSRIQQGEALEQSHQRVEALGAYIEAEKALRRIKQANPDWNPRVVDFRLRDLQNRIAALEKTTEASDAAEPSGALTGETKPEEPSAESLSAEVADLKRELQHLQANNQTLQAKLKEALTVQPASVDPRQLEKSEAQSRALTKQVQLLQAQLADTQSRSNAGLDGDALKQTRQALEQQTHRANQLLAERTALAAQVAALTRTTQAGQALQEENALLKRQLKELKAAPLTDAQSDTEHRLNQALAELAVLRSETDVLRLEKGALEQRVQRLRDEPSGPAPAAGSELAKAQARVAELEQDRRQLEVQLAQANQDLANLSAASVGEPNGLAQAEIDRLKARVAVYEAKKVPYSVGELALFRMSRGLDTSDLTKPKPPEGVGPLVAQAERQFKQGEFPQAEATLKEMLKADESNPFTLANLAATQMQQGRDDEAEAHLRQALVKAPRDPFTLATLGILKFRQQQYDAALDSLGLAVQYDPDNPVVYDYLGMALSEKGMRGPAETALRRAIQLEPGFADAHFNLALVYVLQDPPLRELARWHYQKALQAGHERSPRMEQLLDEQASK